MHKSSTVNSYPLGIGGVGSLVLVSVFSASVTPSSVKNSATDCRVLCACCRILYWQWSRVDRGGLYRLMETGSSAGCNLSGLNLEGADLVNANLNGSDLSWANLVDTDLTKLNLMATILFSSELSGLMGEGKT